MKILAGLLIMAASLQRHVVWADSEAAAAAAAVAAASAGDGDAAPAVAVAPATCTALFPCNCERIYRPVCGTDGKTYSNECELCCVSDHRVANNFPPIYIKKQGECLYKPCKCLNKPRKPLCGSDGQTYANECFFDCENKRRDLIDLPPIKVAYQGVCRQPTCICSGIIIPVCGTDGRTYRNICILQCVSRHNQANGKPAIRVQRDGVCPKEYCVCPLNVDPICASDEKTYDNLCDLQCENRKLDQLGKRPLTVQYKGKCVNCPCPKIYDPVCACNGVTFANPCTLGCENKRRKEEGLPPLSIDSQGVCPCLCTLEVDPVCGSDGKTYGNKCQLRCENKRRYDLGLPLVELAYVGPCKCNCWYCPRNYLPVCGTDGRTYWNRCWLLCNRRNDQDHSLFVQREGPC